MYVSVYVCMYLCMFVCMYVVFCEGRRYRRQCQVVGGNTLR